MGTGKYRAAGDELGFRKDIRITLVRSLTLACFHTSELLRNEGRRVFAWACGSLRSSGLEDDRWCDQHSARCVVLLLNGNGLFFCHHPRSQARSLALGHCRSGLQVSLLDARKGDCLRNEHYGGDQHWVRNLHCSEERLRIVKA